MNRKKNNGAIAAVLLGAIVSAAHASAPVPGHAALRGLPDCANVDLYRACRVDVPNGDFGGGDGDRYYHGTSSFAGFFSGVHSIRAHLHPWIYASRGLAAHLERPAQDLRLTLPRPSDHVYQWLPLTPNRPHDSFFIVHAHVSSTGGLAKAAIQLRLPGGMPEDEVIARAETFSVEEPGDELVASLRVPAGTTADRIGIAIRTEAGSVPVVVDDVFLVRAPSGQLPVEMARD